MTPQKLARARILIAGSGIVAVSVVAVLGWLVTTSFDLGDFNREMWAAVLIAGVTGFLAVLPLLIFMGRGPVVMVRLTMLATVLRMGLMLAGLLLAAGPHWKLRLVPLALWSLGCYMVLLLAESVATALVVRQDPRL